MRKILILFGLFLTLAVSGQSLTPGIVASSGTAAAASPNMLSNGTFSSGTNWTLSTGMTIAGGFLSYDDTQISTCSQTQAQMASPIVALTNYTLSFDIAISAGGTAFLQFYATDDNATYINAASYGNGHISIDFTTPAFVSVGGLTIWCSTAASYPFTISNIRLVQR